MFIRSLLTVVLLSTLTVFAQSTPEVLHLQTEEAGAQSTDCTLGTKYDDGVFNDAYSIGSGTPGAASIVMKFDLPGGTTSLDQVCNCFTRLSSGSPVSMNYEVVIYNDNGAGGSPGTFIGAVNASMSSIPVFPGTAWSNTSLAASGIVLPDNTVYIGARWPGGSILMCGDTSGATAQRSNYGSGNQGASWTNTTSLFTTSPPRAMGIRAEAGSGSGATCTPSSTAMCLNANRFKLEATWQSSSASGTANVNKLTDDTGYFWFFASSNVEVVVKVLNGCGLNNRYWVFNAGLTDVRVTITVTDTKTGQVRTYTNPLGTAFAPIQDTAAFATCP